MNSDTQGLKLFKGENADYISGKCDAIMLLYREKNDAVVCDGNEKGRQTQKHHRTVIIQYLQSGC